MWSHLAFSTAILWVVITVDADPVRQIDMENQVFGEVTKICQKFYGNVDFKDFKDALATTISDAFALEPFGDTKISTHGVELIDLEDDEEVDPDYIPDEIDRHMVLRLPQLDAKEVDISKTFAIENVWMYIMKLFGGNVVGSGIACFKGKVTVKGKAQETGESTSQDGNIPRTKEVVQIVVVFTILPKIMGFMRLPAENKWHYNYKIQSMANHTALQLANSPTETIIPSVIITDSGAEYHAISIDVKASVKDAISKFKKIGQLQGKAFSAAISRVHEWKWDDSNGLVRTDTNGVHLLIKWTYYNDENKIFDMEKPILSLFSNCSTTVTLNAKAKEMAFLRAQYPMSEKAKIDKEMEYAWGVRILTFSSTETWDTIIDESFQTIMQQIVGVGVHVIDAIGSQGGKLQHIIVVSIVREKFVNQTKLEDLFYKTNFNTNAAVMVAILAKTGTVEKAVAEHARVSNSERSLEFLLYSDTLEYSVALTFGDGVSEFSGNYEENISIIFCKLLTQEDFVNYFNIPRPDSAQEKKTTPPPQDTPQENQPRLEDHEEFEALEFQKQVLEAHNAYRELHGASPMVLNKALCEAADFRAEQYAAEKNGNHPSKISEEYDENFIEWNGDLKDGLFHISEWYNQGTYYYGDNPTQESTDAFKRLMWNGSTMLGVGMNIKNNRTYLAATYAPPGEIDDEKQCASNIFPVPLV